MPKLTTSQVIIKNIQNARKNKWVRGSLVIVYGLIIVIVFVNIANIQYFGFNLLNANYAEINTPTDYRFYQTYPASLSGIEVGDASQTIIFQIHIHSDTKITENTPVTIEVEAGVGSLYAQNTSYINVGFYGAQYYGHPTTINGYDLWTGFAGVSLSKDGNPESMMTFVPEGGSVFGGSRAIICWETAGEKPLSIGLSWKFAPAGNFVHTYDYSTVPVYSIEEIRGTQITYAEIVSFWCIIIWYF